ncbi:hypothetical protein INT43_005085 [Umbelopsis isabellina]|uniref:Uncharacterized protein n=1 Tax=Mortierella isabellina TaxID=91625 RepID=A0A8H7PHA5_MORIS|nr:hypothetical protein INT43_005085 [Umbelopsis isabellina]
MSDVNHNAMGPVKPADDDAREIHHADHVHGLHETDKLKHISAYKVTQYAVEEVAYGWNYFAKIDLGEGKFVHARAHKYHDGRVDFYSLNTTPETAIWTQDTPLVYFND